MKNRGVGLMVFALVACSLVGCKTLSTKGLFGSVEKPRVESISPRITGLDLQGVNLAFDVGVLNPYSVPIKSPQFRYGLDVQGAEFLNSETTSQLDLPAKGVGTVTLPVRLEFLDLWQSYQRLKDAAEIPYTLRGALVFSPFGQTVELPLQKSGVFPVLRMPSFSDIQVEPGKVSMGSAQVSMKASVLNPNVFALGLEDLGYKVRLGDIELGSLKVSTLKEVQPGGKEQLSLTGALSGFEAIQQLLSGGSLGTAQILPSGLLKTPYGKVQAP